MGFFFGRHKRRHSVTVEISAETVCAPDDDGESADGEKYDKDGFLIEHPFIPDYSDYCSRPTGEDGFGYLNLYPYEVCGRVYGVSEKTGRPTNRKKIRVVHARGRRDAEAAAGEAGIMPPYAYIKRISLSPPSAYEVSRAVDAGIPLPRRTSSLDVSALLTRYDDKNVKECPYSLFEMATTRRVPVSYFSTPEIVSSFIWSDAMDKPSLFCYMVYCRECGAAFGCAPLPFSDSVFSSYSPGPKELKYINSLVEFGYYYKTYSRRSSAYISALQWLRSQSILP